MVFCTAVAFASSGLGLLSVSGDASMRVLPLRRRSKGGSNLMLVAIIVLMLAVILGCLRAYSIL